MAAPMVAQALLLAILPSLAWADVDVEVCDGSPQQRCKMLCGQQQCPEVQDSPQCAMRKGPCCNFECVSVADATSRSSGDEEKGWGNFMRDRANDMKDKMTNCRSDKEECIKQAREVVRDYSGSGRGLPSEAEVRLEMDRAGAVLIGNTIKECMEGADTLDAKKACVLGDDVRGAIQNMTGRDGSALSDHDLFKWAKKSAQAAARQHMIQCVEDADGVEDAIRQCRETAKAEIEDAGGLLSEGKRAAIEVSIILKEGAEDALLEGLRLCDGSGEEKRSCMEMARKSYADASGKAKDRVGDFDMKKAASAAAMRRVRQLIHACAEQAEENETLGDDFLGTCTVAAKDSLKDQFWGSGEVGAAYIRRAMAAAKIDEVKEVRERCVDASMTKEDCQALIREKIALFDGMSPGNISAKMMRRLENEAAKSAALEELLACKEAGTEGCAAMALDGMRRMMPAGDADKPAAQRAMKLAQFMQDGFYESCLSEGSRQLVKDCLEESGGAEALTELFPNLTDVARQARKKFTDREAGVKAIGKRWLACREVAEDDTEKEACDGEADTMKRKTSLREDAQKVLQRFKAAQVAEAFEDCRGCDKETDACKECRQDARAMAEELGVKPRKFAMMAKLGVVKQVAEAWVACQDEESDDCNTTAKERFMELTGKDEAAFEDLEEKVMRVAQAIQDGLLTEYVKLPFLEVEIGTSGAACVDAHASAIATELQEHAQTWEDFENVTTWPCRLANAQAFYRYYVSAADGVAEGDMDAAADSTASAAEDTTLPEEVLRRLGGRRLEETVEEVNAAQGVDEVVVTDSEDETGDDDDGNGDNDNGNGSPTPAGDDAPTPTSDVKAGPGDVNGNWRNEGLHMTLAVTTLLLWRTLV